MDRHTRTFRTKNMFNTDVNNYNQDHQSRGKHESIAMAQ